jgi:hypothetical protein
VPKVGPWGQLKFEGGSITKVLQLIQVKLPQTTNYNYTKEFEISQIQFKQKYHCNIPNSIKQKFSSKIDKHRNNQQISSLNP